MVVCRKERRMKKNGPRLLRSFTVVLEADAGLIIGTINGENLQQISSIDFILPGVIDQQQAILVRSIPDTSPGTQLMFLVPTTLNPLPMIQYQIVLHAENKKEKCSCPLSLTGLIDGNVNRCADVVISGLNSSTAVDNTTLLFPNIVACVGCGITVQTRQFQSQTYASGLIITGPNTVSFTIEGFVTEVSGPRILSVTLFNVETGFSILYLPVNSTQFFINVGSEFLNERVGPFPKTFQVMIQTQGPGTPVLNAELRACQTSSIQSFTLPRSQKTAVSTCLYNNKQAPTFKRIPAIGRWTDPVQVGLQASIGGAFPSSVNLDLVQAVFIVSLAQPLVNVPVLDLIVSPIQILFTIPLVPLGPALFLLQTCCQGRTSLITNVVAEIEGEE